MRIPLLVLTLIIFLTVPLSSVFASSICVSGTTCLASEVGVFMEGITQDCGNLGNCSLKDIMTVFQNVGNWVLGIVGSLVFIMYIIGGFYFLVSQGGQLKQKGIKMIRTSTIGLLIVFGAYIGMQTLFLTLYGGGSTGTGEYVVCTPEVDNKTPCGLNMQCMEGVCLTECAIYSQSEATEGQLWACLDLDSAENSKYASSCMVGYCPGDESMRCCETTGSTTTTTSSTPSDTSSSSGVSGGAH
jgi:hypothetical protein